MYASDIQSPIRTIDAVRPYLTSSGNYGVGRSSVNRGPGVGRDCSERFADGRKATISESRGSAKYRGSLKRRPRTVQINHILFSHFVFTYFACVSRSLLSFCVLCFRFAFFAFVSLSSLSFRFLCFRFAFFAFVSRSLLSFGFLRFRLAFFAFVSL
jgi:hypothetical protein